MDANQVLIADRSEGSSKPMRKGTRSCVTCRKRKVRCIFPRNNPRLCVQCSRRGDRCVLQGPVAKEIGSSSAAVNTGRSPLSEKGRARAATGGEVGAPDELPRFVFEFRRLRTKVSKLLSWKRGTRTREQFTQAHGSANTKPGDKESLGSECAPLLRLFDSPTFGGSGGSDISAHVETNESSPLHPLMRHAEAIKSLCAGVPSKSEMKDIFKHRSHWWSGWRQSLALSWGDEEDATLESFAARAFSSGHPSLLANLLICFSIGADDQSKYLPLVERWILYDDELAGCDEGLQCLMGLGLILLSIMQPRRAWNVFRRANALPQLSGIHRARNRSGRTESLFWQLFHADRWASLIVGLPYSVPERLCNLRIPPINALPPETFHYRHFAVLTGRVIDCLQDVNGWSLSTVIQVQEQMDSITAQLPHGYLDLSQIAICANSTERYTRLMRVAHVNQLKSLLHLPLFLQPIENNDAHGYSRKICVSGSRLLLEAYLQVHAGSLFPNGVTANLESFAAFTSAIILFLNLLGNRKHEMSDQGPAHHDEYLIQSTMAAIKDCSTAPSALLCRQCYNSLETLVASSREMAGGDVRNVVLPFFGTVSISRCEQVDGHEKTVDGAVAAYHGNSDLPDSDTGCTGLEPSTLNNSLDDSLFGPLDDISLTCYELWSLDYPALFFDESGLEGFLFDEEGRGMHEKSQNSDF